MKKNEYQCAMCGNIYEKGWADEEAEKECVETFGTEMAHGDDLATVCDDCYQLVWPKKHPEILASAKAKFKIYTTKNEKGRLNIQIWEPNLIQRFLYWLGVTKDPRYNGKKIDWMCCDEAGQTRK